MRCENDYFISRYRKLSDVEKPARVIGHRIPPGARCRASFGNRWADIPWSLRVARCACGRGARAYRHPDRTKARGKRGTAHTICKSAALRGCEPSKRLELPRRAARKLRTMGELIFAGLQLIGLLLGKWLLPRISGDRLILTPRDAPSIPYRLRPLISVDQWSNWRRCRVSRDPYGRVFRCRDRRTMLPLPVG